jgi:hypothetical protein
LLLAKQACLCLASSGWQAYHLAYWLGLHLHLLDAGPHAEVIPPFLKDLGVLLLEVFLLPGVPMDTLQEVTAVGLYTELVSTPPPPSRPNCRTSLDMLPGPGSASAPYWPLL